MKHAVILGAMVVALVGLLVSEGQGRREILTLRQKELLQKADRVYVDALALTDRGEVDAEPLVKLVARRMSELGYAVVTDRKQPYDVVFRVKCEERKVWEGTITSGGDADLPDSPSRVWKGPACQLTYLLKGRRMGWHKEVRTDFQDPIKAAADARAQDSGAYALEQLRGQLEQYDFPVLVTADWGQTQRLLILLDDSNTPDARKVRTIRVLGHMFAADAVPKLSEATRDHNPTIATAATVALGDIGKPESIPLLVTLLKTGRPEQRPAAAKALGNIGALNYDYSVIEPLLDVLQTTEDLRVKAAVAWALGRLPDKRSYEPLLAVQQDLHTDKGFDGNSDMEDLRAAVAWSLRQIEPGDHYVH